MKLAITAAATLAMAGTFGGLAACGSQTAKPAAAKPAAAGPAAAKPAAAGSAAGSAAAKRAAARSAAGPAAAKPAAAGSAAEARGRRVQAAAKRAAARPAAPVGQAEVGRLLAADEAAITSAAGGTNAMKASYLVNAINEQRPAWNAVLNTPGLSASAHAGITDWLAFATQIQAYHGYRPDRVQVLAAGARAQEELTSAYPQLSGLIPR